MTKLEALQAIIEFGDEAKLTKVLVDKGIDGSENYTSDNEEEIDLCAAELCLYLLSHPEYREGSMSIKYSVSQLRSMRVSLLKKHDKYSNCTGESVW